MQGKHTLYRKYTVLLLIIYSTMYLYSQNPITMNGTVKNFSNNPIKNVTITSLRNNIRGTSNDSGSFTISTISPIIHMTDNLNLPMNFSIRNNNLVFSLNSTMRVRIEIFNLQGIKLHSTLFETLNKGTHYLPINMHEKSSQILFLCVTLNRSSIIKKYISLQAANYLSCQNQGIAAGNTHKTVGHTVASSQESVIDTLVFSHDDYIKKSVWIYKYSEEITTVMWDKNLVFSDEIPEWNMNPDDFATYDTAQLYDLIDGGATIYNEHGLIDGINQYLTKDDGKICEITINNFGSTQKSLKMYNYHKESVSTVVNIPDFDDSITIGDEILGGIVVYAHFNRFNIELSLRGYTNNQVTIADAKLFLQLYETKIKTR